MKCYFELCQPWSILPYQPHDTVSNDHIKQLQVEYLKLCKLLKIQYFFSMVLKQMWKPFIYSTGQLQAQPGITQALHWTVFPSWQLKLPLRLGNLILM